MSASGFDVGHANGLAWSLQPAESNWGFSTGDVGLEDNVNLVAYPSSEVGDFADRRF